MASDGATDPAGSATSLLDENRDRARARIVRAAQKALPKPELTGPALVVEPPVPALEPARVLVANGA